MSNWTATEEELRAICDMTVQLAKLRQSEFRMFAIEKEAPVMFKDFLDALSAHKQGLVSL